MQFYRCQVTNKDVATTKHLNEKTVLCGYFLAVPHLHGEQIGSQLAVLALKLFTNQPLKLLWVASQILYDFLQLHFHSKYSYQQTCTAVGPKNRQ